MGLLELTLPSERRCVYSKSAAEFFAGIGLMRLGLANSGWTVLFANDIDENKRRMYAGHFGDSEGEFVLGDVHCLSASQVPSVTLATASFPCNDLSLAGSRHGLEGAQSSAFWGFVRVLKEMGARRPPIVMLENVPGFLSSHGGKDIENALLTLNELGYTVDLLMVDAARFVPQSRQRLFVIGSSCPGHVGAKPPPTYGFYESDVRPRAVADFIFSHPDIEWRIRELPELPRTPTMLEGILEDLPDFAPEWWNEERAAYLLAQMSDRHRQAADEMMKSPELRYGTVFRRIRNGKSMAELRTDGVAGCLRTPRGGSGRQILFRAGRGTFSVRLLTPRECARLMGAGDYRIDVPLNQALFGFGDAVCVPAVTWIADNYLNSLLDEING